MSLSHCQNAKKSYGIKIANKLIEIVEQFRYLGTAVTNQNLVQEEIKMKHNLGNAHAGRLRV
jgi:hypothetical protein